MTIPISASSRTKGRERGLQERGGQRLRLTEEKQGGSDAAQSQGKDHGGESLGPRPFPPISPQIFHDNLRVLTGIIEIVWSPGPLTGAHRPTRTMSSMDRRAAARETGRTVTLSGNP